MKITKLKIIYFSLFILFFVSLFFFNSNKKIDFSHSECAMLKTDSGFKISLELAKTPHEHAFGLMFRKDLPEDRGMLFVFKDDEYRTFWMKNTFIPLDIVFLDKKLKIRKIFHSVEPPQKNDDDLSIPRVSSKAAYVLELKADTASKYKLTEGLKLSISSYSKGCK